MVTFALRLVLPREVNPYFLLNEYGDLFLYFHLLPFSRINRNLFLSEEKEKSSETCSKLVLVNIVILVF